MHGPTRIFWANLTHFSLQPALGAAAACAASGHDAAPPHAAPGGAVAAGAAAEEALKAFCTARGLTALAAVDVPAPAARRPDETGSDERLLRLSFKVYGYSLPSNMTVYPPLRQFTL
jgi:hypothetical protein